MGTFNTVKFISTDMRDFSGVIGRLEEQLTGQGYTFSRGDGALGYYFSITKGGIFKTVLGMKTALNVELTPMTGGVNVDAKVGIFGQQVIPSIITLFVAWPVLLTQIGGLVEQSKLDEKVIQMTEEAIRQTETGGYVDSGYAGSDGNYGTTGGNGASAGAASGFEFCTQCGAKVPSGSKFCCGCGRQLHQ